MTIRYYETVPAAAVFAHIDGHRYAMTRYRVASVAGLSRIAIVEGEPRMVRFGPESSISNGVARVYIGRAGLEIAQRANLPFGVIFEETGE